MHIKVLTREHACSGNVINRMSTFRPRGRFTAWQNLRNLVASSCYVVRPGATSGYLFLVAMPFVTSGFLLLVVRMLLVVRPGAPSSVLAPSSDALCS